MLLIGLIYQYDSSKETGLIMLPGGEKREFNKNDWIDNVNTPAIGQKISYKNDANCVEIKVATQKCIDNATAEKENSKEKDTSAEFEKHFANLEDCLEYFVDRGFKIIRDTQRDLSRILILRKYTEVEYGEAIITHSDSKTSIELTLNGKQVIMN